MFVSFGLLSVSLAGAESHSQQRWPCCSVPVQPGKGPQRTAAPKASLGHPQGRSVGDLRIESVGQTSVDVFLSYLIFVSYI